MTLVNGVFKSCLAIRSISSRNLTISSNATFFKCNSFDFGEYLHNKFYVYYEYDKTMRGAVTKLVFTEDEYERLLKFMENPELYKSTKKYNL